MRLIQMFAPQKETALASFGCKWQGTAMAYDHLGAERSNRPVQGAVLGYLVMGQSQQRQAPDLLTSQTTRQNP